MPRRRSERPGADAHEDEAVDADGEITLTAKSDPEHEEDRSEIEPVDFERVAGPDGLISPDNPLNPLLHLLQAVFEIRQFGPSNAHTLQKRTLKKRYGMSGLQQIDQLVDPRKSAAEEAEGKIQAWGCEVRTVTEGNEITEITVKIPSEGRGRPINLGHFRVREVLIRSGLYEESLHQRDQQHTSSVDRA